ncbi:TPA: DUF1240 domain-containing protein [Salmonella enterica]|uniref:DUF1240 domain-containing protein n=1 Tax=Salmonella enterica TaxID=28901 RepID=UPI003314615B
MRYSDKAKQIWSLFFLFFIFFGIISVLIISAENDTYSLIKGSDRIYYDWKGIVGLYSIPFLFFTYIYLVISFIISETNVLVKKNKKKFHNIIMKYLGPIIALSLLCIIIGFISTFFITSYLHSHYTPCDGSSGIYSGKNYVKGGATCH